MNLCEHCYKHVGKLDVEHRTILSGGRFVCSIIILSQLTGIKLMVLKYILCYWRRFAAELSPFPLSLALWYCNKYFSMRTLSELWDLFCSAFFCESAIFLTISMDLIYFSGFEVQCRREQPHGFFCSSFTQFQKLFSYAIYDMDRESGNVLLASLKSFIAWDLIIEECSCTSERKTFYHHTSYSLCFFLFISSR